MPATSDKSYSCRLFLFSAGSRVSVVRPAYKDTPHTIDRHNPELSYRFRVPCCYKYGHRPPGQQTESRCRKLRPLDDHACSNRYYANVPRHYRPTLLHPTGFWH